MNKQAIDIIEDLKVICIILARGGSKGLPNKNLQLLNGESLIARTVSHAIKSDHVNNVIVSTDSQDIADIAIAAGSEVPFIRPSNLSMDLTTTEETLKHALIQYEKLTNQFFDIGLFITCTDIFRRPEWIDESILKLKSNPELESVFVGHRTHKNFWERDSDGNWVRIKDWMSTYSSRQIRQSIVREDTGLACASRTWLWRSGRRIGDKVSIIETDDDFTSIDIHTREDLELAQAALSIRKRTI
tara:strand:+ start:243 stop:974 length:732 start_codon:yes stop_codon:yes gene_type:complete